MRLAGQVRLTTFLTVAGLGLAAAAVAGMAGVALYASSRPDPPVLVEAPPPAPISPIPAAAPASAPVAPATGVRPVDEVVLGYRGRSIGTDKLKDVTSGRPYKVNVYQDAGHATVNRAKIDLDRNDKWDEKITFEADEVTRQVASADDERYDLTFRWDGQGWAPKP